MARASSRPARPSRPSRVRPRQPRQRSATRRGPRDAPGAPGQPGPTASAARAVAWRVQAGANSAAVGTHARLLDAAGEVFAARGLRDATVREICARADANVAAVNYHFGGKQGLYQAVLDHSFAQARQQAAIQADASASPEDQLRAFVRGMVHRMLDQGRPAWHATLMAREMVEPSPALDHVVKTMIGPVWDVLRTICAGVLGEGFSSSDVDRAATSVIGQVLIYKHSRPVIERLLPQHRYDEAMVRTLAAHVAEFSLCGLRGMREAGEHGHRDSAPSARNLQGGGS